MIVIFGEYSQHHLGKFHGLGEKMGLAVKLLSELCE